MQLHDPYQASINCPFPSPDTSLKDGLFHEFKKHGKVTSVQIHGASEDRYGLVFFRQQEDQEKALNVSKGKLFFGMMIEVSAWNGPGMKRFRLLKCNTIIIWAWALNTNDVYCNEGSFTYCWVYLSCLVIVIEVFPSETESENEFRPLDGRIDEFHPKATRTLFIGNLEKTTSYQQLLDIFQRFGEIVVCMLLHTAS